MIYPVTGFMRPSIGKTLQPAIAASREASLRRHLSERCCNLGEIRASD